MLINLWNIQSASKIAYKIGVSRCAVIGKAHRLKLAPKSKGCQLGDHHPHKGFSRRTNMVNPNRLKAIQARGRLIAAALVPMTEGITFAELEPGLCHWPIGDLYCGAPTQQIYCPYHKWKSLKRSEHVQRSRQEASQGTGEASALGRKAAS